MHLREKIINYLFESGFVHNYIKKLMWQTDIDSYYEDYCQEVFLQICEVKPEKWEELMENNDSEKKDEFYTVRNWVSMLIYNTVHSETSAAYRRLKKQSTITQNCDDEEWRYLANTIEDNSLKLY